MNKKEFIDKLNQTAFINEYLLLYSNAIIDLYDKIEKLEKA